MVVSSSDVSEVVRSGEEGAPVVRGVWVRCCQQKEGRPLFGCRLWGAAWVASEEGLEGVRRGALKRGRCAR